MTRSFALIFVLLLLSCSQYACHASRPNVVLIVSDDQGYRDLGCFGSDEILTPSLDRLARSGVRLTNFYVTWPACTPSRGSLLTGRYPQRNGVYDMIRNEAPDYGHRYSAEQYEVTFERIAGMDTREVLLPQLLADAGYVCGIFGKWDLGSLQRYLPTSRGFHQFYGFVNTGIDYFTHERYGVASMYRDNRPTTEDKGVYCTELFRREAVRFLEKNHSQPFFLYLPFNAPHSASNLDPKIRSAAQATNAYHEKYPQLQKDAGFRRRDTRYVKNAEVKNRSLRRLEYAAAITCMDDAIGDILSCLEEHGVADRTIVIFMSDNGGSGIADNSPLRGHKAQMWEGGIRVPCIVRMPNQLPKNTVCDQLLTSLEVFPTLLKACDVAPPNDVVLDGFDMRETLCGQSKSSRTEMFWKRRGEKAARVGDWKWIETAKGESLFKLSNDISESNDLAGKYPQKLAQLRARFSTWMAQMEATEPRGPFRDF